jgi:hypothetical protein
MRMAVSAKFYGNFFVALANKQIDMNSDTIKVALCTSSYTPDQDTHDYFNDITNEVSETGTNYTAGGATIANPTITYTGATNVFKFDGDDVAWANSTINARYAVVYDASPGTAATNPLICYVDFGEDKISSTGNFPIAWSTDGICTITVA